MELTLKDVGIGDLVVAVKTYNHTCYNDVISIHFYYISGECYMQHLYFRDNKIIMNEKLKIVNKLQLFTFDTSMWIVKHYKIKK